MTSIRDWNADGWRVENLDTLWRMRDGSVVAQVFNGGEPPGWKVGEVEGTAATWQECMELAEKELVRQTDAKQAGTPKDPGRS